MSDVIDDDDTDALAAEFVLGTLDADERTHANLLLDIDDDFRIKVRTWERRLGELHLMVEPVEPAPQIWDRIKAKVDVSPRPAAAKQPAAAVPVEPPVAAPESEQESAPDLEEKSEETAAEPPALETTLDALEAELRTIGLANHAAAESSERPPELFPERVAPEPDIERPFEDARERLSDTIARDRRLADTRVRPAPYLAAETDDLRPSLRRWRAVAVMMSILLVAMGGLLAAWRYVPDRLPPQLRAVNVLHIAVAPSTPKRPVAPPESQFDE